MLMSSGDRNIDNNKVNNYEEKLDLAGLIKVFIFIWIFELKHCSWEILYKTYYFFVVVQEERLRTESILRGFKENSWDKTKMYFTC